MDFYIDCFGDVQDCEEQETDFDYEQEEKYICECGNCMDCLGMHASDF